ncbi:aspartate kinase [Algoriphagus hitonicola]|uniref:Aspartokinase n=1 Tax=Algoriphagus hitonicola TaxID=435880 RepID=A0A1I2V1F7_9BACT|nr:aspartate kinase [Algoriphagus hitonicola]SFG81041.1 aspartate kinase [Algoriphagus hitonicola]
MAKIAVYKFGGASVKDADSIKNLAEIFRNRLRKNLIVVVSAMGKTTNALEEIIDLRLKSEDWYSKSSILEAFHLKVCDELFESEHPVFSRIKNWFIQLKLVVERPLTKENYDEFYDQVVSFGELIATTIVMEYLCNQGLIVLWQDARELIRTNSEFRFAKVDWERTRSACQLQLLPKLDLFPVLTQGFIGADHIGRTTTLGREGSDFTAAILAACLDAGSVTIWKDVPGVLNADPKRFPNATLFDELDYKQAAQMTFYGASVIHPKTIKPLANKSIPLYVKSFLNPEAKGTMIYGSGKQNPIPTLIVKEKQILVTFQMTDFSFVEEQHIHQVYRELDLLKLRVNLLQTSAIGISIVIDYQLFKLEKLVESLAKSFKVRYNEGLQLLTIINPDEDLIRDFSANYTIMLEQRTRTTFQLVGKPI